MNAAFTMQIERFYLGCLAHASYLVYDQHEAAVIDPQRDVDIYLDRARELNLQIRWIVETHLHADFVSGHLELAERTGAAIAIAANSGATYPHWKLHDGDELALGNAILKVIATPGHTEESVCILALEAGQPKAVFTGDTLFIGDVGRPDLSPSKTPEELAAMLYDSLHEKLLRLPGEAIVYPAHGAGSLCGRSIGDDASSTIDRERRTNYALQPMTRAAFVHLLTGDLPPRPAYFQDEVARNRTGAVNLDALPPVPEISASEFAEVRDAVIMLDTRPWSQFAAAHIPGSINTALGGQFASWAARILGITDHFILLIAEDSAAIEESRLRLARVGIENVVGALAGGILAWIDAGKPVQSIDQIAADDVSGWLESSPRHHILDVRESAERSAGAITGSISIPLPELGDRLTGLDRTAAIAVHCRGGYRSAIACSLLQSAGFTDVLNVAGGFDAWALANPGGSLQQHDLVPGHG
jgi:hydroxyacylglutathione hydrolase